MSIDDEIRDYLEALKNDPEDIMVHNQLAAAYLKKDMIDEAISAFNEAVTINPIYPAAHNHLALAHYRLAIEHCRKAIELGFKVDTSSFESLSESRDKDGKKG